MFSGLDGFCPTPGNRVRVMQNFLPEREQLEVLASFGEARLVRTGSHSVIAYCDKFAIADVRETYVDTTVNVPGFKAGRRAITLGISGRVSAKRLLLD